MDKRKPRASAVSIGALALNLNAAVLGDDACGCFQLNLEALGLDKEPPPEFVDALVLD
jgi:hypothetical protein